MTSNSGADTQRKPYFKDSSLSPPDAAICGTYLNIPETLNKGLRMSNSIIRQLLFSVQMTDRCDTNEIYFVCSRNTSIYCYLFVWNESCLYISVRPLFSTQLKTVSVIIKYWDENASICLAMDLFMCIIILVVNCVCPWILTS